MSYNYEQDMIDQAMDDIRRLRDDIAQIEEDDKDLIRKIYELRDQLAMNRWEVEKKQREIEILNNKIKFYE